MHARDELARRMSTSRLAARPGAAAPVAPGSYRLSTATALATGLMLLLSGTVAAAGWLLAKSPAARLALDDALAPGLLLLVPLGGGAGAEWLFQGARPALRGKWWQCGLGVWGWLLLAAMLYCLGRGMPALLVVLVLFTYGLLLQFIVLTLAFLGSGLVRWRKRRAAKT